jgi:glutaredoxin
MFTIYTRIGCPYCDKVREVLDLCNLEHEELELGIHFDREDFYDKFGAGSTFPQVLKDGNKLGGCTETISYLKEQKII